MVYSSRDIVQIKAWGLLENRGDIIDAEQMLSNDTVNLNKELAELKTCF